MVIYNIQSRTGVNITPETLAYLAKNVESIVAVKEASAISPVAKIASLCGDSTDIYSATTTRSCRFCPLAGGKGVISVLSNIAPRETHEIVAKFMEGMWREARRFQLKAIPLIDPAVL